MQITVFSLNEQLVTVQVDGNTTVETMKAIVEAETQIPATRQALLLGNQVLVDSMTLQASGVRDGDVLQMSPSISPPFQPSAPSPAPARGPRSSLDQDRRLATAADGSALVPTAFAAAMRENQQLMSQLQLSAPELFKAITDDDLPRMQSVLRELSKRRQDATRAQEAAAREEAQLHARLAADPFDVDAQRRIEEIIQQRNIEENFMNAMEHNPEVFAQVSMLYVDMEVNGVRVKAFIDSGAQMTIMTSSFVEQCHLARLVDKRFKGMALGVGSSTILGRVHQAPLKVAGHFITCSISVLEQKSGPQFIFGLDMLRRHACCIDLRRGVLSFGSINVEVPFLPDSEIPRDIAGQIDTVSEEAAARSMASAKHTPGEAGTPRGAGTSTPRQNVAPSPSPPAASTPRQNTYVRAPLPEVEQLMALGFSRKEVEQALEAAGGNVEAAATLLTFGG